MPTKFDYLISSIQPKCTKYTVNPTILSSCINNYELESADEFTSISNKIDVIKRYKYNIRKNILVVKESLIPADKLFFDLVLDIKKYLKDINPDKVTVNNEEYVMSYDNYKYICKHIVPTELLKYYNSLNYLLFPKDGKGFIVVDDFLRSLQRLIDVDKLCIHLLSYAVKSRVYIHENEVERYIYDLISAQEISSCQNSHRTQRMSVSKLAHSSIMEDLLYLIRMCDQDDIPTTKPTLLNTMNTNVDDNDIISPPIEFNWFSGANTIRLYQDFLSLDQDKNGMLNQEEFIFYGNENKNPIQLTPLAVSRLFEENLYYRGSKELGSPSLFLYSYLLIHTFHKGMDYKTYVEFVVAIENKTSIQSLKYFWRLFNIDISNKLSSKTIAYFYNEIYDTLKKNGYDAPPVDDVISEIFDILGCQYDSQPDFDSIVKSGQGHVVMSILLDAYAFYLYDNRESLVSQIPSNSTS